MPRYNLEQPYSWKHYRKSYLDSDSGKTIVHLHQIEKKLRAEIRKEQVTHWTPAQIQARWKDGRA